VSEPHTPQIENALSVRADMNITKDDLVAIRIAEVERTLHDKKLALIERRRTADAALKDAQKALDDMQPRIAIETIGDVFDELLTVLNKLRDRKDPATVSCYLEQDKTGKYYAHGCVEGVDRVAVERPVSAANVKALRSAQADVKAHQQAITECEQGMLEVKRQLQDIPMLERQAKAAVATAVMRSSTDGGSLLDIVSRTTLPGLPAPKG